MPRKVTHRLLSVSAGTVLVVGGILLSACRDDPSPPSAGITDGPTAEDLGTLIRQANVVILGRVIATGEPYTLAPDPAQTVVDPLPSGGPGIKAGATPPTAGGAPRAGEAPASAVRKRDATITVEEVLRGTSIQVGTSLRLTQVLGGAEAGSDPPVIAGSREVFFLHHDPATGLYSTVAGGQGRLTLDADGNLHVVDPASPLRPVIEGQDLVALRVQIGAIP